MRQNCYEYHFTDIFQAIINASYNIWEVPQSEQIQLWQYLEVLSKEASAKTKQNKNVASEIFVYSNEHTIPNDY